jgi:hypothetical protein
MLAFDDETASSVAESRLLQHADRVVARPSTMGRLSYTGPPYQLDETMRILSRPKDFVMYTSMATLNAYEHAVKRKMRMRGIKELIIHVVDFDFTLAISEIFTKLEPGARALYHTRPATLPGSAKIKVWLTVTREFALAWDPRPLERWLNWRNEERAAGRDFYILYAVSKSTKELSMAALENFRQFLHFIDTDGDMPGDMGGIMHAYQGWYRAEFIRRGF